MKTFVEGSEVWDSGSIPLASLLRDFWQGFDVVYSIVDDVCQDAGC